MELVDISTTAGRGYVAENDSFKGVSFYGVGSGHVAKNYSFAPQITAWPFKSAKSEKEGTI